MGVALWGKKSKQLSGGSMVGEVAALNRKDDRELLYRRSKGAGGKN